MLCAMSKLGARAKRERERLRLLSVVPAPGPPVIPPVRAPDDLEKRYSPSPTISSWISTQAAGELRWDQLDAIRKNAELGVTEQWGDLTRRFLKTDDHVFSTYRTYVAAISGGHRNVVARTVDPTIRAIAEDQAEACAAMLDALPNIERTIAELVDGDFTGWAGQEILWEPRGDWLWPHELVWLHPARFRFSQTFTAYLWDRGMAAQRARELGYESTEIDGLGIPLPANKYIMHMPRIIPDYPQASGIFLDIMRPWWVKNWCMKFLLSGAEVSGNPRMLGIIGEQAVGNDVRTEMYEALQRLSADSVGVITAPSKIEILDPKMQGDGGVWRTAIKICDAAISKAILGSTLNVEVGDSGGNRSLGESQADMTIAPRWSASALLVCNTLEAQLFRPFLELNRHLWGGHVFVPQLTISIVEDEPTVDQLVVDSGYVTVDQLLASRKLPPIGRERGGDRFVKPPAAPMAFSTEPTSTVSLAAPLGAANGMPVLPHRAALPGGAPTLPFRESRGSEQATPRSMRLSRLAASMTSTRRR
jgi:phage gp29-like protein